MCLIPVQVDEEAEQVVAQFDHCLLHVGLKLTSVVDLCGVKHSYVPQWNLNIPVGRTSRRADENQHTLMPVASHRACLQCLIYKSIDK